MAVEVSRGITGPSHLFPLCKGVVKKTRQSRRLRRFSVGNLEEMVTLSRGQLRLLGGKDK